jgi:hypothetical protein
MSEMRKLWTLIGVALVIYVSFGFAIAGTAGVVVAVFWILLQALINVILGIAACFIAAFLLSTNFGTLKSACVKLAAITLFPAAAGLLVGLVSPIIGLLLIPVLFFGLLSSLFDLELYEVIVVSLSLWGVSWAAEQSIGWIQASLS